MTIDLNCQKCDTSFELDAAEIIDSIERLKCPGCDARAPHAAADDLGSALGELCKQVAALRRKFAVSLTVDSDDLPPPYDLTDEEEEDEEDDSEALLDEVDEEDDEIHAEDGREDEEEAY
jgi:hypothetical protein